MTTGPMQDLLADAASTVGQRGDQYGTPIDDFKRIAAMWNGMRRWNAFQYQPHDVAMYMICLKLSRLTHSPGNRDSWLDIAGYAACGWSCVLTEEDERERKDQSDPSYAGGFTSAKGAPGILINGDARGGGA